MKKYLFLPLAALLLASCSNDVTEQEEGFGTVSLAVDTSDNISVSSRAVASAAELAEYNIAVYKDNAMVLEPVKYNTLADGSFTMSVGTGYSVTAESCTVEEGESANDGWGQLRLSGKSDDFVIKAGQNTAVNFTCTVQNAKVTVVFDSSFTDIFTDYTVTVNKTAVDTRSMVFNSTNVSNSAAFFTIDDNTQLTYTVNAKFGDVPKGVSGTLTLKAATNHRITVQSTSDGQITLGITIDGTVTDEDNDALVNPYA